MYKIHFYYQKIVRASSTPYFFSKCHLHHRGEKLFAILFKSKSTISLLWNICISVLGHNIESMYPQPKAVALIKWLWTRPQWGLNRAIKIKVTDTVELRFCYCFSLYANVQLVKRDTVTAVINCDTTTDFHYAKCDSHLSAEVLCYKTFVLRKTSTDILA